MISIKFRQQVLAHRSLLCFVLILIGAGYILLPQITYHAVLIGDDWSFHWNRFYEIAMQLKTKKINYFMSLYSFNQSGRIINAVYGPLFAYFHGILLLLFRTWYKAELVSSFLCISLAGSSMFALARYFQVRRLLALAAAFVYMGSSSIILYATDQSVRSWAAALFPLLLIPLINMIKDSAKLSNSMWIGVSIAAVFAIQIAATMVYLLTVCLFFSFAFFLSKKKISLVKQGVFTGFIALSLSLMNVAGLAELYGNKVILPTKYWDMFAQTTQLSMNTPDTRNYGLVISLIIIFQIIISIISWDKLQIWERVVNSVGIVLFVTSSPLVPWNVLASKFLFLQDFQFPFRFAPMAMALLILGFVSYLNSSVDVFKGTKDPSIAIVGLLAISVISTTTGFDHVNVKTGQARTQMGSIKSALQTEFDKSNVLNLIYSSEPDYLPEHGNVTMDKARASYKKQIAESSIPVRKKINKNGTLTLSWTQTKNSNSVQLPVIIYKRSTVVINEVRTTGKNEVSNIGALVLKPKIGRNQVIIGYRPSILFYGAVLVNMASIICLLGYCIARGHNYRKTELHEKTPTDN